MQTNEDIIRRIAENVALRLIRIYANGGGGSFSLPLAADGVRGGVQVGYTTSAANRNYAVQLDNEKMYVNVPWTDHYAWADITGKPTVPTASSTNTGYAANADYAVNAGYASSAGSTDTLSATSYINGTTSELPHLIWHIPNVNWGNLSMGSDGNFYLRTTNSTSASYANLYANLPDYLAKSGGTMTGAIKYRNDRSGLFNIGTGTTPSGYTTTTAGGNTQIGVISWDGASDEGGVLVGSDCCVVYNSGDSEYVFKVMDKDVSTDLSGGYSAANCLLAVGQGSGAATYVKNLYSAGYVTALSDARKKNVLGDVVLSAEQISQMPAVRFEWKDNKKPGMFIGTLAQNWREILPEAVYTHDDGTLSFDYQSAALVSVINLAREIEAIKSKLNRYGFK